MRVSLVVVEVVVPSFEDYSNVDLKQALTNWGCLLHISHSELPKPGLCVHECLSKGWIEEQCSAGARGVIGRTKITGCLTRQPESERCFKMGRTRPAVILKAFF